MKIVGLFLLLTACGSAGEMFTDAGKCVSQGSECHSSPVPGPTGAPGVPGRDGKDGESCKIQRVSNGAIISCPEAQPVVILNGIDGKDGQDGEPALYSVVGLVDPCGDFPGFDEVLLRLGTGQLLAHYSSGNGNNRVEFLALVEQGNYTTTDGSGCHFSVDSDNQIYNEHY